MCENTMIHTAGALTVASGAVIMAAAIIATGDHKGFALLGAMIMSLGLVMCFWEDA